MCNTRREISVRFEVTRGEFSKVIIIFILLSLLQFLTLFHLTNITFEAFYVLRFALGENEFRVCFVDNRLEQWFLTFSKSGNTFDYMKICGTPKLMIQKTNKNLPRRNKYIIRYI